MNASFFGGGRVASASGSDSCIVSAMPGDVDDSDLRGLQRDTDVVIIA